MDWRIYYGDGATYDSDDGAWKDAPGWNVQVVLFRDPIVGWAIRHGGDFFHLADNGTIVAMDTVGALDYVVNIDGTVKAGRMLTQVGFEEVYQQAKRDMTDLKVK